MHLVQILLPLTDNDGVPFAPELYRKLAAELTERFGGLTAFTRAPAEGHWQAGGGSVAADEIVIFEVMAETLERHWWRDCRADLEQRFRQDTIVVRVSQVELI
jgi:hypothetical protein